MTPKPIAEDAWLLPLGGVNAVLLKHGKELTLVDTGFAGKEDDIAAALNRLGHTLSQLGHLILSHAHPDHIGSAAGIVRNSGAQTWMHPADAPIAETGGPQRPLSPAPGFMSRVAYPLAWRQDARTEPVRIDHRVADNDVLPIAGGLIVIATAGHSAGQIALLDRRRRLLIGADVGTNILGLGDPLGFEDIMQGRLSQRCVAELDVDTAVFGHGRPIRRNASKRMRKQWANGTYLSCK